MLEQKLYTCCQKNLRVAFVVSIKEILERSRWAKGNFVRGGLQVDLLCVILRSIYLNRLDNAHEWHIRLNLLQGRRRAALCP